MVTEQARGNKPVSRFLQAPALAFPSDGLWPVSQINPFLLQFVSVSVLSQQHKTKTFTNCQCRQCSVKWTPTFLWESEILVCVRQKVPMGWTSHKNWDTLSLMSFLCSQHCTCHSSLLEDLRAACVIPLGGTFECYACFLLDQSSCIFGFVFVSLPVINFSHIWPSTGFLLVLVNRCICGWSWRPSKYYVTDFTETLYFKQLFHSISWFSHS